MSGKRRIQSAVGWSALDVFFRHGLNFIVLMILARLLSPSDFGEIAILLVFTGVASIVIDSGFSQALIQRKLVTHVDESSVFFFNVLLSLFAVLLLYLAAPWIAIFYHQPDLELLMIAISANLLINAFGSVQIAILTKRLDFKALAKVGGVATVGSGSMALTAAANGYGVWSLVIQLISSSLLTVVFLWYFSPWRPLMRFSLASIRSFFQYSSYLLLSGLLDALQYHAYALIIGRVYSAHQVGYFNQAQRLQHLPIDLMTSIVGRIAFPVFSRDADDRDRLVKLMNRTLETTMFMTVPVVLCTLLLAEPLVVLLFGSQWLPSVPVLQVLSLTGLLWPFHVFNVTMLKALGRTDLNLRVMLVKFTTGLLLLFAAAPFGLVAIASALLLNSIISLFVNAHYIHQLLDHGVRKQLRITAPYLLAGVPMALLQISVILTGLVDGPLLVVLSLLLGGVGYMLACRGLRLQALDDVLMMIGRRT